MLLKRPVTHHLVTRFRADRVGSMPWFYRYSSCYCMATQGTADLMSPHGGNPMDGSYTHAVFVSEPLIGTKGFNDLKTG
jgi:hypothetical protein